MTSHDFRNDASWSERADLLGQERKLHEPRPSSATSKGHATRWQQQLRSHSRI